MTTTYELDELTLNGRELNAKADVEFDTDGTPRWVDVTSVVEWTDEGNTATVLKVTAELEKELTPLFLAEAEGDEYAPTANDIREEAREASQLASLDMARGK
jgi:hypothetical protein